MSRKEKQIKKSSNKEDKKETSSMNLSDRKLMRRMKSKKKLNYLSPDFLSSLKKIQVAYQNNIMKQKEGNQLKQHLRNGSYYLKVKKSNTK